MNDLEKSALEISRRILEVARNAIDPHTPVGDRALVKVDGVLFAVKGALSHPQMNWPELLSIVMQSRDYVYTDPESTPGNVQTMAANYALVSVLQIINVVM